MRLSIKVILLPLLLVLLLNLCSVDSAQKKTPKKNVVGENVKTADKVKERIVGGSPAEIGNMPYVVSLWTHGSFSCGGTLVSRTHVVTAAHCLKGLKPADVQVKGGATKLTDEGIVRQVHAIYKSSKFNMRTITYDVAVLKLSQPMEGPRTDTINLCSVNRSLKAGSKVRVSGWGLTKESDRKPSNHLRTVEVALISKSKCSRDYRGLVKLTNTMFCAAARGKDACGGDSGGPLVYKNELCGIVSFGVGCAQPSKPGVYTNVNAVRKFIRNAMQK